MGADQASLTGLEEGKQFLPSCSGRIESGRMVPGSTGIATIESSS